MNDLTFNIEALKQHPAAQANLARQDVHQAVLDAGYSAWQKPENAKWQYADMVDEAEKTFGEMAKLLILLGKFNQQVCNGGHIQYYDNGYASGTTSGMGKETDTDLFLHQEMISLFERSHLGLLPHGGQVLDILKGFRIVIDTERSVTCTCGECGGSGEYEDEKCFECGGSGQCEEDNENYQGIDNKYELEQLDDRYYEITDAWMTEVEAYVREWLAKGNDPYSGQTVNYTKSPTLRNKPRLKLIGTDGNAFAILGKARDALRASGASEEVIRDYTTKAKGKDYRHLLAVTMEFCDVF